MFGISLSGITNSQKHLDVTSNNIANANTTGFKESRAEFADVYANSVFQNQKTVVGMGSQNPCVAQQFTQGNLSGDTGNNLDMAIQGNGFFVLANECNPADGTHYVSDRTYTRAGAFQINNEGYLVTPQGDFVQGWNVVEVGNAVSLDLAATHAINFPQYTGAPKASSQLGISVNLPADADLVPTPNSPALTEDQFRAGENQITTAGEVRHYYVSFDPENPDTYTCSTSQTIHDSLGGAHTLTYYIMKTQEDLTANTTTWNVIVYVDGNPVDIATSANPPENPIRMEVSDSNSSVEGTTYYGFQMTFGSDGQLIKGGLKPGALNLSNNGVYKSPREVNQDLPGNDYTTDYSLQQAMGGGVDDTQDVNILFDATQYGSSTFTVNQNSITNDGYSTGLLTNVTVNEDGIIQAEYTNGRYINIAKLAMADFINPQGLTKVGDTQWKQSIASGEATPKEPNRGSAGSIKGANLEESNVDLTEQLVELIVAQRNYQANAQSLQTQNTVMDAILNVR